MAKYYIPYVINVQLIIQKRTDNSSYFVLFPGIIFLIARLRCKDFIIQHKQPIIIYVSFLNCGRLLIREVQWFYWTQELLVPVEKFTVGISMMEVELARGCEGLFHHWHPHCKFLYWYQEFLCPVEPLYFSDEKSNTDEK